MAFKILKSNLELVLFLLTFGISLSLLWILFSYINMQFENVFSHLVACFLILSIIALGIYFNFHEVHFFLVYHFITGQPLPSVSMSPGP